MFSDTAKKSAFSDAAAFSGAQKTYVPGLHTATTGLCLVTRQKSQHSVTLLQRLVTLSKDVHLGIHTATTSPCLVTRQKTLGSVTPQLLVVLRRHVHPSIHTATTTSCLVTRQEKNHRLRKKNVPLLH